MSIYLDEKNPEKHKPFDDASPDIAAYVRYLEVIAGKSPNTAFSYYCDLRNFSRFMKRRRGFVTDDTEIKDVRPCCRRCRDKGHRPQGARYGFLGQCDQGRRL